MVEDKETERKGERIPKLKSRGKSWKGLDLSFDFLR